MLPNVAYYRSTYAMLTIVSTGDQAARRCYCKTSTWCAHHAGGRTRTPGPRKMQRWSMIKCSYPKMHVVCVLCWIILYHTLISMCILHVCVVYIVHACVAYIVLGRIMSHTTRYYRSRLILHQAVMPPKPYFRCICRQTLIWTCSLLGFKNVAFLGFEAAILCTIWLWLHQHASHACAASHACSAHCQLAA